MSVYFKPSENKIFLIKLNKGYLDIVLNDTNIIDIIYIQSKHVTVVNTKIQIEIPSGFYGKIECLEHYATEGLLILGGVIDSDYRGEIKLVCYSLHHGIILKPKIPLARIVIIPYKQIQIKETNVLTNTFAIFH